MDKHRIVCAGEVMIEMASLPDEPDQFRRGFAGDTFNTAIYLARAGLQVDYLTKLGDDADSHAIIDKLTEEGIGSNLIAQLPNRQPGLYLIENDADGERRFSYWRDNSPAREMFAAPIKLPDIDAFFFSGITLAVTRSDLANLVELVRQLKETGRQVIFDPNYRPQLWQGHEQARDHTSAVLPYCDIVMPTLADDESLWNINSAEECQAFYAGYNVAELIIKAQDLTAHAFIDGKHHQRQAQAVAAVDTTGAGDAFNAGYLVARLTNSDIEAALDAGHALAARVVQHPGAIIPRSAEPPA